MSEQSNTLLSAFLKRAYEKQKSVLCPVIALAIESNYLNDEYIRQFPSKFKFLSIKKILLHAGLDSTQNKLVYRQLNRGINLYEISKNFEPIRPMEIYYAR